MNWVIRDVKLKVVVSLAEAEAADSRRIAL